MTHDLQTQKKLIEFFESTMTKERFARICRQLLYETIGMTLMMDESQWYVDKEAIFDAYLWLNEFCEMIDPQLTRED